jgi:hypothetical protein
LEKNWKNENGKGSGSGNGWNAWNWPTVLPLNVCNGLHLSLIGSVERFERSGAIEPLEPSKTMERVEPRAANLTLNF